MAVACVGIGLIGAKTFVESTSPIAPAAASLGMPGLLILVGFGAAVATLSVLLGDLLSGSRTAFAMARNNDLPAFLSEIKGHNPQNSVLAATLVVLVLPLAGNLIQVAPFTSLTILLYYSVTNASAFKLKGKKKLYPRAISVAGLVCCIGLAIFLPLEQWIWTGALIGVGLLYLLLKKR